MLSQYLKNNVHFLNSVPTWEEAIKVAAQPLLDKGNITRKYVQDMIENVNVNGSYMVIVPGIAMPHAKNNGGVLKTGISCLKLKDPVFFPEEKDVNILFVLAAEDTTGHLELISDLSSLLIDEDVMVKFKEASSEAEIIELIESVE
ncbi:PTS sugar transporter subunit IIA [Paenactinomyces guangxiensis]|uniref:Ascorbate-specific PTS system EIIA component n=1 Tax=Paenactinomyces guangxiensis TaxID=1490290 RepID=A0A7W2A7E2_9BACL|nr:PTS sugar transporter subunit IIA [Paenactinomyces guangxiensis]MBA4493052.1 PTS sugar transporter subunit IIA [Paenactinomyces guangxiensis]MBH8590099.1 PTS sugar transporter subunit IIA [Paenactinomyces guangxiensis]